MALKFVNKKVILRDKIYVGFCKKIPFHDWMGICTLVRQSAAEKIGGKLHNTYTDQLYRKSGEEVHNTQPNHLQVAKQRCRAIVDLQLRNKAAVHGDYL